MTSLRVTRYHPSLLLVATAIIGDHRLSDVIEDEDEDEDERPVGLRPKQNKTITPMLSSSGDFLLDGWIDHR